MTIVGSPKDTPRILVFRTGHLGDTIIALPAFWAIRRAYPDSHIAFLTNAPIRPGAKVLSTAILPEKGLFDEVIGYEAGKAGVGKLLGPMRSIGPIRKGKFDKLFYLMTRNRTSEQIGRDRLFFKLCGVGEVLGADFLESRRLPETASAPLQSTESEEGYLLDCVRDAGLDVSPKPHGADLLALSDEEKQSASSWLSRNVGEDFRSRRLLGVGPGSKWESKIWMEDRYVRAVGELVRERDVFPVIFGGNEDAAKADRLIEGWGTGASAAGKLGVRAAGAALSHCDLYIGNDTGTMHLAAAAGVKCVAIFAAVDYPGRWEPIGEGHRILRVNVPCEGCHSPNCDNENQCLTAVGVGEVVGHCLSILDGQDE